MNRLFSFILILIFAVALSSCEKEEFENPLQFETNTLTIASAATQATIKLRLERPAEDNIPVTVRYQANGLTYNEDFTTNPEEVNGTIFLTIPTGSSEVTFTVNKQPGITLLGNEIVSFTLETAGKPATIGATSSLTVHLD
ncbi:hypothetical protein [Pontibacter sp. SGAir0037]|uniref:hypothetical protein n=1 Tax=Pontibacter sp. SGAir0037 TaxID=2571030 RepID=UPI0010CD350E|nr:hypothetical protein [Pontibacter sp. SGAir0037]QCR23802.1 hypothetical protein C1N53_16560 [Pontibacter sp. SGAir0037]